MKIEQTSLIDKLNKENASEMEEGKGITEFLLSSQSENRIGQSEFFTRSEHKNGVSKTGAVQMNQATYQKPEKGETKTAADQMEASMAITSQTRKNQMAVLSNTMTSEDYQQMEENGFTMADTSSKTIITVTDKIKAKLARAGVDISGYGDQLSQEQLTQIMGSSAVANQVEAKLQMADLPVTTENKEDMVQAYDRVSNLPEISEDTMIYLVKNDKVPTIDQVYKATYSNSMDSSYVTREEAGQNYQELETQLKDVIKNAGLEVNSDTIQDGKWLIANEIPVTAQNISYLKQLKTFQAELSDFQEMNVDGKSNNEMGSKIMDSMIQAIKEGERPSDGYLTAGYSLQDQAENAMDVINQVGDAELEYCISNNMDLTIYNLSMAQKQTSIKETSANSVSITEIPQSLSLLTARRQLEEIRLSMTTEVNYALLKKGISIDTKPLEALVQDLKDQENSYYRDLLSENHIDATDENVQIFADTTTKLENLKYQPAYVLSLDFEHTTIDSLYEVGAALESSMKKAGESYETLMTAPRADMGDSIQKAFQNVDDILQDLDIELTDENRRAVRILAYNETEITKENIQTMKAADEEVQRTFKNLTPVVTLEMIRRNINPLDMPLSELNQVAEKIDKELGTTENERFSKFLWKLDQSKSITKEERESYMGIYRLITQVEKTDGSVIGSLVNQGADLTMRNLLSAVRTKNKGSMEYKIDNNFDGVNGTIQGKAIDEQIIAGYQNNCLKDVADTLTPGSLEDVMSKDWENMTPEQMKAALADVSEEVMQQDQELIKQYNKEQLDQFTEVLNASEDVYEMLDRYEMPNTMMNVMAASRMMRNPNKMFDTLFVQENTEQDNHDQMSGLEQIRAIKDDLLDNFAEAVKSPEELADAQENLAEVAENVMKTMIIENDTITSEDLRELRIMCQQFDLCSKRTKQESYMIPIQTGDSVTGVSLKVVRGTGEKGLVDIFFRGEMMGKVAASFQAKEKGVSGMIATDNQETQRLLSDNLGLLASSMNPDGNEPMDVSVAFVQNLDLNLFEKKSNQEKSVSLNQAQTEIQTSRLYHIAESFIGTLKSLME